MKTNNILSEAEYQNTLDKIEHLLIEVGNNTSTHHPKFIELDNLSNLVADYEEKHYPVPTPSLKEVIELRMFERKLTQKSLALLLGISATRVSEYMRGKREITMKVAKALYQKLDIDPEIILSA